MSSKSEKVLGHSPGASVLTSKPRIALIVGPTAVGKTEISLLLAKRLGAEIVSVDSRLFYRGMDIGTAKPNLEDRARVPHHLIDIAAPDEIVGLAVFQKLADDAIRCILARGRLPVLVGGTGQYIRAIVTGWLPPTVPPNTRLRRELSRLVEQRGAIWLHAGLNRMDPAAASIIDPRNVRRTIRAVEVVLETGSTFSRQRGSGSPTYDCSIFGLQRPRAELYARIDRRIDRMWELGLLDETRRLLSSGCDPQLPSMSGIGYAECASVIAGTMSKEEAQAQMRRRTRALVRRQANWFRLTDPAITWFDASRSDIVDSIEGFARRNAAPTSEALR